MPLVPQESDAHALSLVRDVQETVIHQTRPPFSIDPWSSSDVHVRIVGTFGDAQGSAWTA